MGKFETAILSAFFVAGLCSCAGHKDQPALGKSDVLEFTATPGSDGGPLEPEPETKVPDDISRRGCEEHIDETLSAQFALPINCSTENKRKSDGGDFCTGPHFSGFQIMTADQVKKRDKERSGFFMTNYFPRYFFSIALQVLLEPTIAEAAPQSAEVYRFTRIRFPEWEHPPFEVVRVESQGAERRVIVKRVWSKGSWRPGQCAVSQRSIGEDTWSELQAALEDSSFWDLPPDLEDRFVKFPTIWLFEGAKAERAKTVFRYKPFDSEPDPPFGPLGRYFIKLGELEE
jgi:hypothetical protein